MKNKFPEWWDKGLEDWSVESIFEKLNSFGIKIDKDKFLVLTEKYSFSQDLSESELYPQTNFSEDDNEEDFVWMAADELWKKLRADKKSLEMIAEEIEKPFEEAEKLGWERYKLAYLGRWEKRLEVSKKLRNTGRKEARLNTII